MSEEHFNEPFDDQEWLDIGADLRVKIRTEFSRLRKHLKSDHDRIVAELKAEVEFYKCKKCIDVEAKLKSLTTQLKEANEVIDSITTDILRYKDAYFVVQWVLDRNEKARTYLTTRKGAE